MSCSGDGEKPSRLKRRKIQNNKALTNEEIVNLLTVIYFSYFDSLFTCHAPARDVAFSKRLNM